MKIVKITAFVLALSIVPLSPPLYAQNNMPAELQQMHAFLGLMQKFYGIVDSMNEVSGDPTRAAIMQMYKIQEIYEQRGEKAKAADVFQQVLKDSQNPTLRNAATLLLGDLYKETGKADEAIKVLSQALNENVKRAK
jgi:predicted negative regulator of RcsB-dependent stress response